MCKVVCLVTALVLPACARPAPAPDAVNAERYLRQQGWKAYEAKQAARSPLPDITPVVYYAEGNSVPSCGIVTGSMEGKSSGFIELVGSDPGVGFPQCLGILSITPFRLQNSEYVVVEYLSRETREDIDRHYSYLVRDRTRGFVEDEILNRAIPSAPADVGAAAASHGVWLARAALLTAAYPEWYLIERDLISDQRSSFAIFEDRKARRCHFVAEAGAVPVAIAHTTFLPASACAEVLASSRYEKNGKVFYLAMFRDQDRTQRVGIVSVSADGSVIAEKALAEQVNRAGAVKDIKSAKAALIKQLP